MTIAANLANSVAESGAAAFRADRDDSAERRVSRREPAHDLSEIVIAGSRLPLTCLVRNLSRNGAMIEAAVSDLPDRFILTNHGRRNRVLCEVVWRRGRHLGVTFLTSVRSI